MLRHVVREGLATRLGPPMKEFWKTVEKLAGPEHLDDYRVETDRTDFKPGHLLLQSCRIAFARQQRLIKGLYNIGGSKIRQCCI